MPKEKPVEARHQTQHKLEVMNRYWRTWGWILAHNSKLGFCSKHLWLVDTMAGAGRHESIGDVDGWVPGSPLQGVFAARSNQIAVHGVTFHVRAIDNNPGFAADLEELVDRYRGDPPDGVDVEIYPEDWRDVAARIGREISAPCEMGRLGAHGHRSLWFIDPYGVEPLDHKVINALPFHAEVIVNFDENTARRHAGRQDELEYLSRVYRDDRWKACQGEPLGSFAEAFMEQFTRWPIRNRYGLRATGAQDRFLIHLTMSEAAVRPFKASHRNGLKAGTLIAGGLLSLQEQRAVVLGFADRFKGMSLSIDEMYALGTGYTKVQLRTLAQQAHDDDYARWDPKTKTVTWFSERYAQPTLDL